MSKITSDFFVQNRKRLYRSLGEDFPIILSGNNLMQKSADTSYPFTQDSSFWYFSGIDEPGYLLVIERDETYIISPKSNDVRDTFDGAPNSAEILKNSGASEILSYEEGWERLKTQLESSRNVATLAPLPSYIEQLAMYTSPARRRLLSTLKKINPDISIRDFRSEVSNLRMIKQPIELQYISRAIEATKKAYEKIEQLRVSANNERDLLAGFTQFSVQEGYDFAYDPIIASGKNAITLHYTANNAKLLLSKGILIDAGLRCGHYNADITRTVFTKPTARQQSIYDAVLSVQAYAIGLIRPGLLLADYETAVMEYLGKELQKLKVIKMINKHTVREYFPHATSHFLGIDVHDAGDYARPLESGVVLTVEPGIYLKNEGIGIRIEDDILVTKTGSKNLSKDIVKNSISLASSPV